MTESPPIIDLSNRKVIICTPSADYMIAEYTSDLLQMIDNTIGIIKIGVSNQVSSRIAVNRNILVEKARMIGGTDILWIDSDTRFPITGLVQLLRHDRDIVCATTCARKGNNKTPIGTPTGKISENRRLADMKFIGMPFMLTKISVFDKIDADGLAPDKCYFSEPPRWMMRQIGWPVEAGDGLVAEDEYFCYLAHKAGFDVWCDLELSMNIGHVGPVTNYIEDRHESAPEAKVDEVL